MPESAHAPTVVIEDFHPCLEGGRHAIKRIVGEPLQIWCDIFTDGHVVLSARLKWRRLGAKRWHESTMQPGDNDRWSGRCQFDQIGRWQYGVEAWVDRFLTWRKTFAARVAGQDPDAPLEALEGAQLLREGAQGARAAGDGDSATELGELADLLGELPVGQTLDLVQSDGVAELMQRYAPRHQSSMSPLLPVIVERERARFSAWYEFFPRNALGQANRHSTLRDCVERLRDAKAMGFDVVYFPPIHPIGITARKGPNNTLTAGPQDVGSPWAIGGPAGGHRDIEPALGSLADFDWLLKQAQDLGLEIALDFAINCSPDHPYVREHPQWFHHRPDGSIRYAENPPKKYQDIYPLNFHGEDWRALWDELIEVVLFWAGRGVRIFRVDNPHTKPVAFWEELIAKVQRRYPDCLFLSEAFTRPKMMQILGKVGFSQSYTYFTWRESKAELTAYAEELTQGEMRWYYRGNFWPNTPDILPAHLQKAPASAFRLRAALAATLMPSWGIYSGYELCENEPLPGREEYLDSEKFQLRQRDFEAPGNIKGFIRRLNEARRHFRALQLYDNLRFHHCAHDQLLCFSKCTADFSERLLIIINLNAHQSAAGMVDLQMNELGLAEDASYEVTDWMHGQSYRWQGRSNYVELNPQGTSMHLFAIQPCA
jgi:starch synthase (maltosyl-transferring)